MKWLLLDIGEVLMREKEYAPGLKNLDKKHNINRSVEKKLIKQNSKKIDIGEIPFHKHITILNSEMKKINPEYKNITTTQYYSALFEKSTYNKELIKFLKEQRQNKKFKICIFSNNFPGFIKHHTKNMRLKTWTEHIIYSHKYKLAKPNPAFYKLALKKIKAKPEDCFLLDDNKANIDTAFKLKMKGHTYKNNKDAINAIKKWMN